MKVFRMTAHVLAEASRAHARWELDVSRTILGSKKRLFILFLLMLPAILFSIAVAADALPSIIGGKEAYGPAFYSNKVFIVSMIVGLCAGLITGCIGAGGGFIIAPALMTVGVKGILAVGTDLFHIFAKAIMGTAVHKKLGNVSIALAIAFLVGSIFGATAGGLLNRTLYDINPVLSDAFISMVYT
ncbi:MAG: sulfite exporter TauE/SafE family protein, partial [Syntrophobacterales bacterium]|nr:sulfite exporter TauE/SafE family protein [Syntrophobacterales bacterium]